MVDPKKVIEFIQLNAALGKAASAEIKALRAGQEKQARDEQVLGKAIEQAADALIKAGHLTAANRPSALRTLRDPLRALAFVERLAAQKSAAPAAIGEPVAGEKQASAGTAPGIVKAGKKPSDEAFERGFRSIMAHK